MDSTHVTALSSLLQGIRNDSSMLQRFIYSHDLSTPPKFIMKFIKNIPDIVVQPESVEDVLKILEVAKQNRIPITPRGAATSAYGGAIPLKAGIVIDFSRMNRFEVDEDAKLLKAEAGAVWWDIQKELVKRGLSLRVYPTSAPSSTVGGWIAAGGYGIGSLKYGGIADNVASLTIADFLGVKMVDEGLNRFVGLCGSTGLILNARIKLRDFSEDKPYAEHMSIGDAVKAIKSIKDDDHPAHSALFINSSFLSMKNQVKGTDLPEKDTLLLCNGKESNSLGEELWEDRFYPMRIKRLGPSLVTFEALIPLDNVPGFYREAKKIAGSRHGFEIWFSKDWASVLLFMPSDERTMAYSLHWLKVLKLLRLARKLGGKEYSYGLWLSHRSRYREDFPELYEYKREIDPHNLLNPGKFFPEGVVPRLMNLAELMAAR
jgi:FAD/FMN-containing dehydrogenase